jgi:hypothetical protein
MDFSTMALSAMAANAPPEQVFIRLAHSVQPLGDLVFRQPLLF